MKSRHVMSAVVGVLGVVTTVGATQLNQGGQNLQPCRGGDAQYMAYQTDGVFSNAPWSTELVASVDHNPSTTGEGIWVDGCHFGPRYTYLTLYAHDYAGRWLGSNSNNVAATDGCWSRLLSVSASQTPSWAYLSLYAVIPGNHYGKITGFTVIQ